ncbi:sec7 and TBC domain-containing protein [Cryptosporidium canis]|nr:sec7 and TBC domain-containing protein [Cryptosporidium canis]
MAPSKPSISKVETERTMEGPYGHKSGHTESPKDNEETPNQSQVDSRAPELEAACPDSPENPNPGYSHSLEPDACQNPIKFFKTVSALEAEQPRFASNSSSVSLPLKRISQEDWSGSGVNGSSEDNKLVIPSLSTRKIRQILVASRRSNSSHQVHDNASMVLRQHGRYSQTPSVRSVDSVSGTFVSVQSCGPLIEGGGGGKSVQFDQDYSNLTLDECNSCRRRTPSGTPDQRPGHVLLPAVYIPGTVPHGHTQRGDTPNGAARAGGSPLQQLSGGGDLLHDRARIGGGRPSVHCKLHPPHGLP